MKKIFSLLLVTLLMMFSVMPVALANEKSIETESVEKNVGSIMLMDYATGKTLYEFNSSKPTNISGVNKIMSMIVVFNAINTGKIAYDTPVLVSEKAFKMTGSRAFLELNNTYKLDVLIKAVAMNGANDAMMAIAEAVCGNEDTFVKAMNDEAARLGLLNTKFVNSTGAGADGQLSTARDVAIMSKELLKNEKYTNYSKEFMWRIVHPKGNETELVNSNRLVRFYDGCDGLMTGSDKSSNYCISATAKNGGFRLVAVVLNGNTSEDRATAIERLFELGFANFVSKRIFKENEVVKKNMEFTDGVSAANIISRTNLDVVVGKGKERNIEKIINIDETIVAPLEAGQIVGNAIATLDGAELGKVDLVVESVVDKSSLFANILKMIRTWLG